MKGIGITVIGLAFLLQTLGVLSAMAVSYIWPIALLVIGLTKLFSGRCSCCSGKDSSGGCCQTEGSGGGCCQQ